MILIGMIK
jgi:mRNA cap methylation, RNMT-activating mini protein